MPKPKIGECRRLVNGYEARIRVVGGERQSFFLPGQLSNEEARERTRAMSEFSTKLVRAGFVAEAEYLLKMSAKASNAGFAAIIAASDALLSGRTVQEKAPPVASYAWRAMALRAAVLEAMESFGADADSVVLELLGEREEGRARNRNTARVVDLDPFK